MKAGMQLNSKMMCKNTTKQSTYKKKELDFRGHVPENTEHGNRQPDCFGCIINTSKIASARVQEARESSSYSNTTKNNNITRATGTSITQIYYCSVKSKP